MLNMFRNLLHSRTEKEMVDEYLADSVDLVDLENRIRKMDRGEAPWQVQNKLKLNGWSY